MRKLTNIQKLFVKEYLIDLNATQAAIRSGDSEATASNIGRELLQKTTVAKAIKEAMYKRTERTKINADYVLNRLLEIDQLDVMIFQVGRTYHPNHAGIYLGDNPNLVSEETPRVIGKPFFLHHLYGENSRHDIYGYEWDSRKRYLLRHQSIKNS